MSEEKCAHLASTPIDSETLDFLMNPSPDKAVVSDPLAPALTASPFIGAKLEYADDKFSFSDRHRTFQMKKIKFILQNWNTSTPPVIKVSIVCTNDANALRRTSGSTRASVEVKLGKGAEWTPAEDEGGFAMERSSSVGKGVWTWSPYFQFTHQSFFASSKKPSVGALILNFSVEGKLYLSTMPVTVVRSNTVSDTNNGGANSVAIGSLSDTELGQLVRKRCGTKASVGDLLKQLPEQKNKRGKVDLDEAGGDVSNSNSNVFSSVFEEPATTLREPVDPSARAHTLTAEEVRWCQDLKIALDFAGIAPPNGDDYMIAQFAIIAKGKTDKAVQRIENYNRIIVGGFGYNTAEAENSEAFGFLNRQFPGLYGPCYQAAGQPVTMWSESKKYIPGNIDWNDDTWKSFVHDFILFLDACNCDLEEARTGMVCIQGLKGVGWKNFSAEIEKRATCLYENNYPAKFKRFYIIDAGIITNAILGICRLFVSKKIMDRMVTTSLADLFNVYGFNQSTLPPLFGGAHIEDYEAWSSGRLARRAESIRLVKIPER
ncbi:hypothetical protein TL16_g03009 [Triparma laevis f. inornata]|uniref:CRAL-TRIO domain-containing protein n=2 Tax=Triparma laevis TaxID=1534972 RepID=A0A9W7FT72_9STRA|nr:hypothetical protein TL16_g03009 [Triparma laevis f. inornata]GMI17575.1 hypothetical protein TrLO_g3919 [Triparma laevis f. longispina]